MIVEFALAAVLHAVPCDSDLDCATKNGPGGYGTTQLVPQHSPKGGNLIKVEEDGSADYDDGWLWDPTTTSFEYE